MQVIVRGEHRRALQGIVADLAFLGSFVESDHTNKRQGYGAGSQGGGEEGDEGGRQAVSQTHRPIMQPASYVPKSWQSTVSSLPWGGTASITQNARTLQHGGVEWWLWGGDAG